MAMTRAEAEAYLASRGVNNPMSSPQRNYSGVSAADMANAGRPPSVMPWLQTGSSIVNEFNKKPSNQDRYYDIILQREEEKNRQMGLAPKPEPGFFDGIKDMLGIGASVAGAGGAASALTPSSWVGAGSQLSPSAIAAATPTVLPPAGMTAVGSAMDGGLMYAPTAAAEGGALSGLGSGVIAAAPYAAALAAAAYGGYKGYKGFSDAKKNHMSPAQGAWSGFKNSGLPTAAMAGAIGGAFAGHKHKDQYGRDEYRGTMKEGGFVDDNYDYTLSDGSKFNFGLDGKKQNYNVDFSRAGIGDTVAGANPLALLMSGDAGKKRSDLAGQLTNAAMSSGNSTSNLTDMYKKAGYDHDTAYGQIHTMQQAGKISQEAGDQAKNALDQLYGVGAYAKGRK